MNLKTVAIFYSLASTLAMPTLAQADASVEGYWAAGYSDGQGGDINFELTVVGDFGQFRYTSSNWESMGFGRCEYVFSVKSGAVSEIFHNSGADVGICLDNVSFAAHQTTRDSVQLILGDAEFGLEAVELSGIIRPSPDPDRLGHVTELDVLGIAPGMTLETIDNLLIPKGFVRDNSRESVFSFEDYVIDHKAWRRDIDASGVPQDWVFVTFTSKKDWAPEELPIAATIGREWTIPAADSMTTDAMLKTLTEKYGAPSVPGGQDWLYDQSGRLVPGGQSCGETPHQKITVNYMFLDETGTDEVSASCSAVIRSHVGSAPSTGRATQLKLILADVNTAWADYWLIWRHFEGQRLEGIFDAVSTSTGAAPDL